MNSIEEKMLDRSESEAERYLKKYPEQMACLESKSLLAKVRESQGGVSAYDIYALGKQLESWDYYRDMCEADGTLSQLGKIPDIALDVISVVYGTSPLTTIASTQPIDEEHGTVHYKNIIGSDTRGNVTAGDILLSPTQLEDTAAEGYAGDQITETVATTVAATLSYGATLAEAPIRPYKVEVTVPSLNFRAIDDGAGVLLGNGIFGTINYTTGAVTVDFAADPGNGASVIVKYHVDFEAASDIPRIHRLHDTKPVRARIWALKETAGIFQSFALRKRFGTAAEDEMATDLVSAVNAEMMHTAVKILVANAVGNTNYTQAPPASVSLFEHKQSFKDTLATAESAMLGVAGRGMINVLVAGRTVCALIQTLPGFTKISDSSTIGPHIFGMLDGITIVRVPNSNVLSALEAIALYKGPTPFESALVHAPFMPLVVTTALPTGANPLTQQKAAAVWSALDPLVPAFSTKITFV